MHANVTRGLGGGAPAGQHVMKLNYTSLQHPVEPVETASESEAPSAPAPPVPRAAPSRASGAQRLGRRPGEGSGLRIGYVQTGGGALPGALSRDVVTLRDRGLLTGHITAAPAYGGEQEALTTVGPWMRRHGR